MSQCQKSKSKHGKIIRHHNTKATTQVKMGYCADQLRMIAERLGLKYEV